MTDERYYKAISNAHSEDYVVAHQALKDAGFTECPFCKSVIAKDIFAYGASPE